MTFWRLFYHLVWATRDRQPIIDQAFETSLHNVMAAKARTLGGFVYAVGGVEDHIHLVVSIPPSLSVAAFVGQVKGNASHWVNHQQRLAHSFAWQDEYGVTSFGGKALDSVVRYVKNQREHHRQQTLIAFLERDEPEHLDEPGPRDSLPGPPLAGSRSAHQES